MSATMISPTKGRSTIDLPSDVQATVKVLKQLLGGQIEVVPVSRAEFMVVREDGKLVPHEPNEEATNIAQAACAIPSYDYIAGDAIIVRKEALALDTGLRTFCAW